MKRQRDERSRKRGRTSTSGPFLRWWKKSLFSECLFLYPFAKLSAVRSSVTREGKFRKEFSRENKKQRTFFNMRRSASRTRGGGGKACDLNTFGSTTWSADLQGVPNDDDSMNRRRIERVDENISIIHSGKFNGGILPREGRGEKCTKWTRRRSDRIVKQKERTREKGRYSHNDKIRLPPFRLLFKTIFKDSINLLCNNKMRLIMTDKLKLIILLIWCYDSSHMILC